MIKSTPLNHILITIPNFGLLYLFVNSILHTERLVIPNFMIVFVSIISLLAISFLVMDYIKYKDGKEFNKLGTHASINMIIATIMVYMFKFIA